MAKQTAHKASRSNAKKIANRDFSEPDSDSGILPGAAILAWQLFANDERPAMTKKVQGMRKANVDKALGAAWSDVSDETHERYMALAEAAIKEQNKSKSEVNPSKKAKGKQKIKKLPKKQSVVAEKVEKEKESGAQLASQETNSGYSSAYDTI